MLKIRGDRGQHTLQRSELECPIWGLHFELFFVRGLDDFNRLLPESVFTQKIRNALSGDGVVRLGEVNEGNHRSVGPGVDSSDEVPYDMDGLPTATCSPETEL